MNLRRAPGQRIQLAFRLVTLTALVATYAQVTLGGVVRATESGLGCPDWPLCYGRIIPPFEFTALVEYSHRLAASALSILVLAVAVLAWLFYRQNRWIIVPSILGLALAVAAAVLGGITVLAELDAWVVMVHLGLAELVLACLVILTVVVWMPARSMQIRGPRGRDVYKLNSLVLATGLGLFFLILFGSYMVGRGAGHACDTWPLCNGSLAPEGASSAIHMAHRYVAAGVGLLVIATAVFAWSQRTYRPDIGLTGLVLAAVFAVQVFVGAGTVWAGFASQMKVMHLSLATLVWLVIAVLATLVYSPRQTEVRSVESVPGRLSEVEGLAR